MSAITHKLDNGNMVDLFTFRLNKEMQYVSGQYISLPFISIQLSSSNYEERKRFHNKQQWMNEHRWYRDMQFLARIMHDNDTFYKKYYDELHKVRPKIASSTICHLRDELRYLKFEDNPNIQKTFYDRSITYNVDKEESDYDFRYTDYLKTGNVSILNTPVIIIKSKRWWKKLKGINQ